MTRLLRSAPLAVALAGLLATALPAAAQDAPLTTVSERSGFVETGRYDEVIALCDAFAARYPDAVRCETFGTSPEGRPMKLLVATRSGAFTPEAARQQGLPVTLIQGGIHAGEIDGKDAGFLALRELLEGQAADVPTDVLAKQVFLFVPVFNVDGHERFGAWNRPNQRGPKEMGWRTTAQNYNLNRGYVKADAPEMQAMLALINRWDPLAYVDLHVTNGAKFQHDISIQVEPVNSGDEALRAAGKTLRGNTIAYLAGHGSLPLPFYPSFVQHDNPASGFEDGVATPRFSHGYMQLRNRLGMLVETHSWKEYPHRVKSTHDAIMAVLGQVAQNGKQWLALAHAADARARKLGGDDVALSYAATDECRTIDFLGYAYTRTPSSVSGATMTRYDETTPETWTVPLCDDIRPELVVEAPDAGYLVPAAHASWVAERLDRHAIEYRRLENALSNARVEAFRADSREFASQSVEGHQRLELEGNWARETHDVAAGALFVPIAQPKARLVMAILEPRAPDALAAWGEFNNAFERKEYMEDYVAEEVAREMLERDPKLKAEFEKRLREDAEFAASPRDRLDFFYRRHSSYDERYNLYPVLRTDRAPR
ncbi:peptidase M14 [Lysobacter arseniciresistens ZS79]|uniref:Peptidase M14 n=1 Tax=Lysobacter arseniciresistens ZS79 TaxID=913325 RepID=A0A0A0F5U6_9GAMM|nr:M14 family metallopeptidase [Lysobacter arseniciresistens]KGM57743.1 peptidase M14 [Lysobacter arseniciresistens ZS79]